VVSGQQIKDKRKRIKVGRIEKASGLALFFGIQDSGFRMQDARGKFQVTSCKREVVS